jgi:hypothetical protein
MLTYSEQDYASGDGMLTTVWGPSMWHVLHTMSFNYPTQPSPETKRHYRDFMLNLVHVLPCKYCRMNLKKNYKTLPLRMKDMESRATFSRYVYDLHEVVNKMLKKDSKITFDEVRERYEHFRSRCVVAHKTARVEKGCTEPLYGKKAKGVIMIVPQTRKCPSMQIDRQCIKRRCTRKS